MPRDRTTQVRIYCICGQRMKVGSDMYGRPGKCIACRQKIRVPRLDEIPEDTDEIHLIDHPEFLRSVKRSPDASATDSQAPDSAEYPELPPDEAPGADRVGESGTVALDVCEPLRTLASLEHRLTHKIELLEQQPETQEEIEVDARELRAFRKRVKRAREELDEQLRQRLMETAIELTTARETIGELLASGRVGEMKFAAYREQAEKLRRRRDSLERRQANLRGWLSARNPYEAGGYVRLPLDHPPPSRTQLSFPHEPPDTCALVDWWVQSLRDAMVRREQQERTCAELDRMKSEERVSPGDVDLRRAEAAAEAGRAKADIAFCRERLEELGRDYAGDQRTLAAQLDLLRGRLDVGEIYRDQFDDDEKALLGIKADLAKACDLIKRSLSANSAQDVPRPHGTYLGRLAEGGTARRVPPDAWILWGSALAIVIALVLPAIGASPPVAMLATGTVPAYLLVLIPLGAALLTAGVALIPGATHRGLLALAIWLVLVVAAIAFLHECRYSLGAIGDRFRDGGVWHLRPGIAVFVLALCGLFVGAAVALIPRGRAAIGLVCAALVALLGAGLILSDFGGLLAPVPAVIDVSQDLVEPDPPVFDCTITVGNLGRRTLTLSSAAATPHSYQLALERRSGTDLWEDAGAPTGLKLRGMGTPVTTEDLPEIPIAPGVTAALQYRLSPGEYRVVLAGETAETFTVSLPDPPQPSEIPEPLEPPDEAGIEDADPDDPPIEEPDDKGSVFWEFPPPFELTLEVRLVGIVNSDDKPPEFSFDVRRPNGLLRRRTLSVQESIDEKWLVAEYNPEEQTVTLSNGDDLVIFRRGDRYYLSLQ